MTTKAAATGENDSAGKCNTPPGRPGSSHPGEPAYLPGYFAALPGTGY